MSLLSEEDSLEGKSWVEICDAEQIREKTILNKCSSISTESENAENGIDVENFKKDNVSENRFINETINQSLEEGEILDQSTEEVNFEALRKTSFNEFRSSNNPSKTLSYAKVVRGIKSESNFMPSKTDTVATDDLSLTSHLDVFHVASPLKDPPKKEADTNIVLDEDTVMYSPCKKEEIPVKNMKRPFQLIESPVQKPRPRSASDSNIHKIAKSKANSDVHSLTVEEVEESIASSSDDGRDRNFASPNLKRELEVNPEILSRRQKQIDYGKNTLGYDRYIKVIPKHKRRKEHPKTPPKHLKMSRRTWDGLIKNWRLKLHQWDPISEKDEIDFENANFDQYSFSSEEPSNYDSSSVPSDSTPSTPKQRPSVTESEDGGDQWTSGNNKSDCSKELWTDSPQEKRKSNIDEFLGCELLTENCVNACS